MATKTTAYLGLNTRDGVALDPQAVIHWIVSKLKQFQIQGATISQQTGYWDGYLEDSLAVSVISDTPLSSFFRNLGTLYCHDFQQEAVLVERQEVLIELHQGIRSI